MWPWVVPRRRSSSTGFQAVRVVHCARGDLARHLQGRVLLAARSLGLRQDHLASSHRRVRAADRGQRRSRRRRRLRRAALPARGEHRLPAVRAVPSPERVRQRRVRAASPKRCQQPRCAAGCTRCSRSCTCQTSGARKPSQLSGGQQQRVALARALVNLPTALLLDEPLGALDLKLRKAMQMELKRIQRDVGITFVYVTHDQEEALTMSDRIAVMNRGRVEQLAGAGRDLPPARPRPSSRDLSAPPTCSRRPLSRPPKGAAWSMRQDVGLSRSPWLVWRSGAASGLRWCCARNVFVCTVRPWPARSPSMRSCLSSPSRAPLSAVAFARQPVSRSKSISVPPTARVPVSGIVSR